MERRKFLAVATSAFALGLAGCSGATDEENQSNETDEERSPNRRMSLLRMSPSITI